MAAAELVQYRSDTDRTRALREAKLAAARVVAVVINKRRIRKRKCWLKLNVLRTHY